MHEDKTEMRSGYFKDRGEIWPVWGFCVENRNANNEVKRSASALMTRDWKFEAARDFYGNMLVSAR